MFLNVGFEQLGFDNLILLMRMILYIIGTDINIIMKSTI